MGRGADGLVRALHQFYPVLVPGQTSVASVPDLEVLLRAPVDS